MKPHISLLIAGSLLFAGAGCSTSSQGQLNATDVQNEQPANSQASASDSANMPSPGEDLEKFIVDRKNAEFKTYTVIDVQLSSGYPVVFSNTSDPAVRFTTFSNFGGDGADTSFYFINQTKWKIVKVEASEFGGDFGASGNLSLTLNDGAKVVMSRAQSVNDQQREITYSGLRVNGTMRYSPSKPLILKPKSAQKFTVLGVSPDLSTMYFSDSSINFSYDIIKDVLQEITTLPTMAKPIANPAKL